MPNVVYPFVAMEIGDKFDVPRDRTLNKYGTCHTKNRVASAANQYGNKHNMKFRVSIHREHVTCRRVE